MKRIINNYYNLYPDEIKYRYGGVFFVINDISYLLTETTHEPQAILNIYELLFKNHIGNFLLINNLAGNAVSVEANKFYILYKIRCEVDETLMLKETIKISANGTAGWSKLWSERINYYEVQINELAQDKLAILQSINYYIGLAENAIAIAAKMEKELDEKDYAIQHYRMNVPVKKGEYFNPSNMLIDINVRDIAEYIKSSFFNNSRTPEEYINYLLALPLDVKKANLLLARLLYPTYYFDLFDEIVLNEREEKELIPIINEVHRYERFLINLYEKLSTKTPIIYIEWLKKGTKVPH